MIKKRFTLSLVALISSVFLFVFASFAWIAVSDIVSIGGQTIDVVDIEVTATLEVSDDGVTYIPSTQILFENTIPGTITYYRIVLENVGNIDVHTKISLEGFIDSARDELITTVASKTLLEQLIINANNTVNSEAIVDQTMISLLPVGDYSNSSLYLVADLFLAPLDVATVYFSLEMSGDAGNDYQNLELAIGNIIVQSVTS